MHVYILYKHIKYILEIVALKKFVYKNLETEVTLMPEN